MKLAILGSGMMAAHAALRFAELGADVRVYAKRPWLDRWQKIKKEQSQIDETLKRLENSNIRFQLAKIERVHKARIHPEQTDVKGRSRLQDMFRIVVSENPEDGVLKQAKENPEVFEKLGSDVLQSLHETMESFHDVDIVIACFDEFFTQPGFTNSGAPALNENRFKHEFVNLDNLYDKKISSGNIMIVGGNNEVLNVLSSHQSDLTHVKVFNEITHSEAWEQTLKATLEDFDRSAKTYQEELHQWRALEDYIRVKMPMPVEPKKRVQVYEEASVISIDKLMDRPGTFVTLEKNEEGQIETLCFETLVNARNPVWDKNIFSGLALPLGVPQLVVSPEEPGFYALGMKQNCIWDCESSELELDAIEEDIMRWFRHEGHS